MNEVIDLSERRLIPRPLLLWATVWPVIVVVEAVVQRLQSGVPWGWSFVGKVVDYVPLALMSIGLWFLFGRLSTRRPRAGVVVATHLVAGVVTVVLWKGLYFVYLYRTVPAAFLRFALTDSWMYQVISAMLAYAALVGVIVGIHASRRERERERREAELVLAAREAELAAVKAQLHPHFLLNSLNSILALVTVNPERAREMIIGLADLLHAAFDGIDQEVIELDREIELVRRYLEIEQIRFADRLRVVIECEEPARAVPVPPFLLQPIVENAVKHGITRRAGEVSVRARLDGDRVRIDVRDPGDGASPDALDHGGRGLELTRRRLDSVYGDDYALVFEQSADGFVVRLDLPAVAQHD